ncbi:unnamed protein product [Heligmosomoides polygyrus]|uniref:Uncharacterized protein n=1 Tax=Heligmosomoides polygyrus TaxID=6339 RepID=A0A183F3A2_HELPZ|nr:unnamed protein product [Heligmosomoides polygyrus]
MPVNVTDSCCLTNAADSRHIAITFYRRRNPCSPSPPSTTDQLYSKSDSSSMLPAAVAGLIFCYRHRPYCRLLS